MTEIISYQNLAFLESIRDTCRYYLNYNHYMMLNFNYAVSSDVSSIQNVQL